MREGRRRRSGKSIPGEEEDPSGEGKEEREKGWILREQRGWRREPRRRPASTSLPPAHPCKGAPSRRESIWLVVIRWPVARLPILPCLCRSFRSLASRSRHRIYAFNSRAGDPVRARGVPRSYPRRWFVHACPCLAGKHGIRKNASRRDTSDNELITREEKGTKVRKETLSSGRPSVIGPISVVSREDDFLRSSSKTHMVRVLLLHSPRHPYVAPSPLDSRVKGTRVTRS